MDRLGASEKLALKIMRKMNGADKKKEAGNYQQLPAKSMKKKKFYLQLLFALYR